MRQSICSGFQPIRPTFGQRFGRFLSTTAGYGAAGASFGAAATMMMGWGGAALSAAALLTPPVAIGAAVGAVGMLAMRTFAPNLARSIASGTAAVAGGVAAFGLLAGTMAAPFAVGTCVGLSHGGILGIVAGSLTAALLWPSLNTAPQLTRNYHREFGPLPRSARTNCAHCARSCKQPVYNYI